MMRVGTQLTLDGKPCRRPRAAEDRGWSGRASRRSGAGGAHAAGRSQAEMRAPGNGAVFVGIKGLHGDHGARRRRRAAARSRWAEYKLPPQLLPRGVNHQQDWIRACKGGAPGVSHFPVATKYIEWLALAAMAQEVPGKLIWDAQNMRFSNSAGGEQAPHAVRAQGMGNEVVVLLMSLNRFESEKDADGKSEIIR